MQIALLALLTVTVGLSTWGWLAGLAYGVVLCALLNRGMAGARVRVLSPADRVTLGRAILVGGVTALAVHSLDRPAPIVPMVALTAVALALDAVDGYTARRTGTSSALGARFDMEVDSFLVLVLCLVVAPSAGPWVLVIGAMRYLFVAASWVLPWMRGSLPPRYWRKVVAAAQGVLLTVAMAQVLGSVLTLVVLLVSLGLLVESFGRDVRWLWTTRRVHPAAIGVQSGPAERAVRPGLPERAELPAHTARPERTGRLERPGYTGRPAAGRGTLVAGPRGARAAHERPAGAAARDRVVRV
ncbi:CDP-alcohol phosphatidyltransferase family protein [Micromonospora yangpuensis]|uniref:CDP-alcohol phosphatidyltransferase family protein n=1 Tax=Micromonospora yangpuensis TaxID=683228 RepID=UPI0035A23C9B